MVEDESFKDLALMGLSNKKVMSRPTLSKMIKERFDQMVGNLMKEFEKVEVICITADIWSCATRSFIGNWFEIGINGLRSCNSNLHTFQG